jgi:hypothetical protein
VAGITYWHGFEHVTDFVYITLVFRPHLTPAFCSLSFRLYLATVSDLQRREAIIRCGTRGARDGDPDMEVRESVVYW